MSLGSNVGDSRKESEKTKKNTLIKVEDPLDRPGEIAASLVGVLKGFVIPASWELGEPVITHSEKDTIATGKSEIVVDVATNTLIASRTYVKT